MSNPFSPSLMLAGMDYIAPSTVCIKPAAVQVSSGLVERHGVPSREHRPSDPANTDAAGFPPALSAAPSPPALPKVEVMKISLRDCLACSGCVTTAESVLVESQSRAELLAAALTPTAGAARPLFITVSDASAAALGAWMGRPATEALRCVAGFFKHAIPRNPGQRVFVSDLRWALAIGAELTAGEYLRRRLTRAAPLPLIVSACPGWVCYCEKQGGALLSRLSPFLSPQGIAGSLVKRGLDATCYHVSIQPCFDRKLEAARDGGFWTNGTKETAAPEEEGKENEKGEGEGEEAGGEKVPYTDCVLSTAELLEWMREVDETLPWRAPLDSEVDPAMEGGRNPTNETLARVEGSGGYLHQAMLKAWGHAVAEAEKDTGDPAGSPSTPVFEYETKRNRNHQLVRCAALPEEVFCVAYGFQQIQNIVRGLKKNLPAVRSYTFIEMMACPDGCLNGGGQIRRSPHTPQNHEATLRAVEGVFEEFLMNPEHVSGSCLENGQGGEANCRDFKEEESHSENLAKKNSTEAPKWDHATSSCQQNGIHAPASTGEGEGAAPAEKPLFSQKFAREILERVGLDAVRCVFVDRQKDFEEMLNKGNIQSLKW